MRFSVRTLNEVLTTSYHYNMQIWPGYRKGVKKKIQKIAALAATYDWATVEGPLEFMQTRCNEVGLWSVQ